MTTLYRAGRQADALHAFQRARRLLADDLGVEPGSQLVALERAILMQDPTLDPPAPAVERSRRVGPPLPVLPHELIGRVGLVTDILRAHDDPSKRLLTLLGPGGVGKTSLALAAAHEVARGEHGIVAFIDLADTHTSDDVLPAIASGLDVDPTDEPLTAILDALGSERTLLIADNAEQITDAGSQLARLAEAIGAGTVIVTSRTPLRVRSEHLLRVPPVSLERRGLAPSDAMMLFATRASASRSGFALNDTAAPIVDDICRRLDGLPLALELAAARLRTLPLSALAERLGGRLDLLSDGAADLPTRHRSLRAVLETTWSMLPPSTAELAARLSVFDAPWSLDIAELVAGMATGAAADDAIDAIDAVTQLVDVSLLPPPDEAGAYRFLESVRAYAGEQLSEARRSEVWLAVAERLLAGLASSSDDDNEPLPSVVVHAEALLRWSTASEQRDLAGSVVIGMERTWTRSGELRRGLEWARSLVGDPDAARHHELRAVAGSFATNLQLDEAVELLEGALAGALDDARRHQVLVHLAQWAGWRGDLDLASHYAAEALEAARATMRRALVARALSLAAWLASIEGDAERALRLNVEAIAAAGEDATPFDRVGRLHDMVDALLCLGRHDDALVAAERGYEATTLLGASGHSVLPDALTYLGAALVGVGRPAEAIGLLRESIRQATTMERHLNVVETLVILAAAQAEVGATADALEIWGATDAFHASNGTSDMGYSILPLVRAAKQRASGDAKAGEATRRHVGANLGWRAQADRYTGEESTADAHALTTTEDSTRPP